MIRTQNKYVRQPRGRRPQARFRAGRATTPLPPNVDPSAGFDGCLFEIFGDELAYVRAQDPNLVWTTLDSDGQLPIATRFHFVNHLGYLIASVPVTPGPQLQRRLR
jgi:hypothetical protein